MENLSVILFSAGFLVLCLVAALAVVGIKTFVERKRHELRVHVRERYVIKNPVRFRGWVNNLSWLEVYEYTKVLDGEHILEHLDGILQAR